MRLFTSLESFLEQHTSAVFFQTLSNGHVVTHEVEHGLHAFCIGGDICRIIGGRFIVYHHENLQEIDYLCTIARICHLASHLLATLEFLNAYQICSLASMESYFIYGNLFSAAGYGIWSVQLIWRRFQENANDQFVTELLMQGEDFYSNRSILSIESNFLILICLYSIPLHPFQALFMPA